MIERRSRSLRSAVLLAIGLGLGACASTPHHDTNHDQLLTTITADGQKQFTFIETLHQSNGGRHGHGSMAGGGGMGGGMGHMGGRSGGGMEGGGAGSSYAQNPEARQKRMQDVAKQSLKARLAATGFCRDGYTELDNQMQHGQIQVKGQCVDTASAKDRIQFPNPVE